MAEKRNVEWSFPENVELRLDEDGVKRWYLDTRDGPQRVGQNDRRQLCLDADHFKVGTKITLEEPLEDLLDV